MRALTEPEVVEWCQKRGLEISEQRFLSFRGASPLCLVIEPVNKPHQALHLADLVLEEEDGAFQGGLLWVRERGVWSEIAERVGEQVIGNCRALGNETRSLDEAPGQLFDSNERLAAQGCLVQPILVGWDAFFVSEAPSYFAFISHDGPVCLIPKSAEAGDRLKQIFAVWKPQLRPDYYFG